MLTVKLLKNYTTINGNSYEKGKLYQLRSREASELIENGAAKSAGYKGK